MKVLQSILIFSVCLAAVYILPATLANESLAEDELLHRILQQIHAVASMHSRALTPGESACAEDYNKTTIAINNRLVNQTNICFENANKTTTTNNSNVNKTITTSRNQMLAAQQQISNCTAYTDNGSFLNCTIATFDINLQNLNAAYTNANQATIDTALNQNQVIIARESCVNVATSGAKTNLSIAVNDYNLCLKNTKYDRLVTLN